MLPRVGEEQFRDYWSKMAYMGVWDQVRCVQGCWGSWLMSLCDYSLSSRKGSDDCGRTPMTGKRLIWSSSSKRVRRIKENCKLVSFTSVSRKVTEQIFLGATSRHVRTRSHCWSLLTVMGIWLLNLEVLSRFPPSRWEAECFSCVPGQSESLWLDKSQTLASQVLWE